MKYTLKGSLRGYLCRDCVEPLQNMEVLLYLPSENERVLASVVANTKETFHLVSKTEAEARQKLLIGKAISNEKGEFEFQIDGKFANSAFDIDFKCGTVPRTPPKPPRKEPIQFHLTTIYPEWRHQKNEQEAAYYIWDYSIPPHWWCTIRGQYFDAWVICGRILDCKTQKPLTGIKVTAWDADFLSDDNLGSAVTDWNGHFRIDYTSADFKKTFLSPLINIETDKGLPLTFNSGPDVYFKFESEGVALAESETSAQRRQNVGYCLCEEFCIKGDVVPPTGVPASFFRVGNYFINEDIADGLPNVISAITGKTPSNQAFYQTIKLKGSLNKLHNGQPLEYCFETIETSGPGGAEIGVWKKITAEQMGNAEIGFHYVLVPSPWGGYFLKPIPYKVGISGGVNANHWIPVPQESNFAPNVNGDLLHFNTASLNGGTVNMAGMVQGQSTTSVASLQQNRYFKIRMRIRAVGDIGDGIDAGVSNPIAMFNTIYNNVPKYGKWMPSTRNEYGVASVDLQELIVSADECNPITNSLNVKFTGANPNMGSTGLTLEGPGGPYTIGTAAPISNVPETFGTATKLYVAGGAEKAVADLKNCAYTVHFGVELKLTDGETQHPGIWDRLSFCKK